jgi:hypothetical protein
VEILGLRVDLPVRCLRALLKQATVAVRERLMSRAPPELQEEIRQVLKSISSAPNENARDFSRAEALVELLHKVSKLHDEDVIKFAEGEKFDCVAASIALLSGAPTELIAQLLEGARSDLMLIPCKSARLSWSAVESILRNRPFVQKTGDQVLWSAAKDYDRLSLVTAQRTLRFWQVHNKIEP